MTASVLYLFFFFNDTATTEIYTLSLHDALPISFRILKQTLNFDPQKIALARLKYDTDRKSTRLNSSHHDISYAVFCLKKKFIYKIQRTMQVKRRRVAFLHRVLLYIRIRRLVRGTLVLSYYKIKLVYLFFLLTGPPPESPLFPNRPFSR